MKSTVAQSKEDEKALAVDPEMFPAVRPGSPADMILNAVSKGTDLAQLEKLLDVQMKWEQNEAKKAYHRAMTAFKADPPSIEKDKKVSFGNTKYNHASLANVTQKINDALSKHGLSVSWEPEQKDGLIKVTCKITHEQGHSESASMIASADSSGSKNPIQAIGSALSYLQRYTLLSVTGLAPHEMDDDGKGATELISKEEKDSLVDSLISIGGKVDKFLEYMGVEKMEDIPKANLSKALMSIDLARKAKEGTLK